ncbi:MAG TPA: DUF2378 family protein [Polyangiaceae bacterium]|nr:DUF2378 family protein [Polyangiaceae bacterium]
MGAADPDVVLPLAAHVPPARHARSTLILASIGTVRQKNLFAEYERALPEQHKETLLGAIAATWIPIDAAVAHYRTCDTLALSTEQQVQNGRSTFEGARGTLLGTAVRMARGAGLSPWTMLPHLQRFWDRGFDGGGISVVRTGPKDAQTNLVQCATVVSPYFRNGLRGLLGALMELSCTKAYVTERRRATETSLSFRVQWA